jgi:hypothetical protein
MARNPTPAEITKELNSIGGGNDYFAAQARLQHRLDEAERAVAKLTPVVSSTDAAPWAMEPTPDQILHEAKSFGLTLESSRENLQKKFAANARRLASFSPAATAEISEALAEAEAAHERAESVLADHENVLSAVTTEILALGALRQKISIVKSLLISADNKRQIAHAALNYFVQIKTGGESIATNSGFRAMSEDLAFRTVLTDHVAEFVAPMEKQAATLIASIRAQAQVAGMDLKKVLELLTSERAQRGGEPLLPVEYYRGLV